MLNLIMRIWFMFRSLFIEYTDKPIITSLLDVDMYKLTMMQLNWLKHPQVQVKYGFNNRDKNWRLAEKIPYIVLAKEIRALYGLKFTSEEIDYLATLKDKAGKPIFRQDFLASLSNLRVPDIHINVDDDGQYVITTEGTWHEAIIVETLIMSIISELNARYERRRNNLSLFTIWQSGDKKLSEKIAKLRQFPEIVFSDFGTRRRFSKHWQMYVLWRLHREIPSQFHSTSNLHFGMTMNIPVVGSTAHEEDMVYAALYGDTDEGLRNSHQILLSNWWELYGEGLSIALTDTFGSEFFYQDFSQEQAHNWWGYRPDSGDPFENGYRLIEFLQSMGVDPLGNGTDSKMILFSDGLDTDTIIELHKEFHAKICDRYGWGTGLMNDMGIAEANFALKIVMKAIAAKWNSKDNWVGTVKLSDDAGKHTGADQDIERYQRVFSVRELA